MGTQVQLIFTACIVNLVLTSVQLHDQLLHRVNITAEPVPSHDKNERKTYNEILRKEIQGLMDSYHSDKFVALWWLCEVVTLRYENYFLPHKNGPSDTVFYCKYLQTLAYDTMKEELRTVKNRNVYKKKNYYNKMNKYGNIRLSKRETNENGNDTISFQSIFDNPDSMIDSSSEEENTSPRTYGTTLNYPLEQDVEEKKDKTPGAIYRGIVERCINLFWGQQEQLLEMRIRERRIRAKTNATLQTFFNLIKDTEDYIKRHLDLLGDKFWNPRYDFPPPMKVDSVRYFEDIWNKVENVINGDLKKFDGIENECNEVRDFIRKAREELPVRFEDIQRLMRILSEMKQNMWNYTTTEGTTVKEWVLSLKSLRRNDTRRATFQ